MKTLVLNGYEILQLGFTQGEVVGVIIRIVSENYTVEQKEYVLNFLRGIAKRPERFYGHTIFGEVVELILNNEKRSKGKRAPLLDNINEGSPVAQAVICN